MKTLLLSFTAIAAILSTSSCNTFIGIGRDLRLAGQGMENAATKVSGGGNSSPETSDPSGAPVY